MPLLSWWWQTAFVQRGSQDALQVTPSVLWKIIENVISLCPARIQSRLSQQGRMEMFLAHLSSVIALLCSTCVLTHMGCWTCALCIAIVASSLETWKIQYFHLTPNWTVMGRSSMQITSSYLIAEQKPMVLGCPIRCWTLQQNQNLEV